MRPDPRWTAGFPSTVPGEGLHQTFARQARTRPDAVAVVEQGRSTSYAELDAAANSWAARLAARGAGRGTIVPVLLPRSTELVTALLAVLKTGAAYCLLPPDWPGTRLRDVIHDLRPPLLVTDGRPAPMRPGPPVWSPPAGTAAAPPGFRPVAVDAGDPCCVFLTSGTTGRPKCVLTPHRATARLFQPGGFAPFTADTVMPLAAATPWDAFSLELWSVLLNGGTSLVVTDPYLSPTALSEGVSRHGADTAWLTSSLFNMIVDESPDAFRGLRRVLIGGERVSAGHVRRFLGRHPGIHLVNGYGPVENTVFATTHHITDADCDLPGGIPLGRPVAGTGVHVLDGTRPCDVGETGEICLAGDGLALEYVGDPALTAEKFTRVRIDGSDTRVYRTGDLGRWDADGLLHYGGRADRQLKIRGHRVEPAEVERQIEEMLPAVRRCRVLAAGDADLGTRELIAFCVPARPADPLEGTLEVLHEKLVAYHRPASVVSVDAFPMTAHGKLDERSLLAAAAPGGTTVPAVPPREPTAAADATRPGGTGADDLADPLVRTVADAFAALLGCETVPLDVPFVQLGGTSLGAGRLCARLSARLSHPVPVSWLYQHPTVAALARRIATDAPPPGPPAGITEPGDDDPSAAVGTPLSPMQLLQLTRGLTDPEDRTSHCLLFWVIEGELDVRALEAAVTAVHQRHEALRAAYVLDPRPQARPTDIPPPPLETLPAAVCVDDALQAARTSLAGELAVDEGEVWRTVLVPVGNGAPEGRTAVLACVVHHAAFDGWSERVLSSDLSTAYRASLSSFNGWSERVLTSDLATGHSRVHTPGSAALRPRPSLTALHRRRRARPRQPELASHREHLRAELAGVPPLRWPEPSPAPVAEGPGQVRATLPAEALARVDEAAAEAGVTRFVVLLALWGAGLADVTGQRDFAVGVPVAQRDGVELEHAIGCHINMLCLRLRGDALDGGPAGVRRTAEVTARAFAAQDVALEDVLPSASTARDGRPPLYQTLFAYQDNAPPVLDLPGAHTVFVRQPYLDLPLELHAELWPEDDGSVRLEVAFRPEAVAENTARDVAKLFAERVHTLASGVLLP